MKARDGQKFQGRMETGRIKSCVLSGQSNDGCHCGWTRLSRFPFLICMSSLLAILTALAEPAYALPVEGGEREAYVSLLYGNFYALPLRTLMRSLLDNSPDVSSGQRDRVVLVTGSTSDGTIGQLRSDGITVKQIPTVHTPYGDDPRFDKRFGNVMTKLAMFNLTEYKRIVFVDADALVRRDMSDIFRCGRFCATFINPCHFNSGLMLVTPSSETFDDMLKRLPELPSYDGGDQGFLNSYYPQMLTAPMYDPHAVDRDTSQIDFVRLPFAYHMDHTAFYPRLRWDHSTKRCGGEMREEEWLGPSFAKPWIWWTYFVLDQSWVWHEYRSRLDQPYPEGTHTWKSATFIIGICYVVFLPLLAVGHWLHHSIGTVIPRFAFPFASISRRYSLLIVFAVGWWLWIISIAVSAALVPPLLPPVLAFATLVHLRATFMLIFLVFPFGAVACCGQRSSRGLVKSLPRSEAMPKTSPTLRRIILESPLWVVVDAVFVHAANFIMWQMPFTAVTSRLRFLGVLALLQSTLTSSILIRLGHLWLSWAGTLYALNAE